MTLEYFYAAMIMESRALIISVLILWVLKEKLKKLTF